MSIAVVGIGAFVFFSFLSAVVVLFALARSSQISHWEEGPEQSASHDREVESNHEGRAVERKSVRRLKAIPSAEDM